MALPVPPSRTAITSKGDEPQGIWQKWFNLFWNNSAANTIKWMPSFTGLTGTATITGAYNRIGGLLYFQVLITPVVNTTAVLGATYINNLPFKANAYGTLTSINISSKVVIGTGQIDINTSNAYVPGWTAVTAPIAITGFVQI